MGKVEPSEKSQNCQGMKKPPSSEPGGEGDKPSEFDRQVDELIESRLTDEHLANQWDLWSGMGTRGGGQAFYGWRQQWNDIFETLWITRTLHKGFAVAAVLALCSGSWILLQGTELNLSTPQEWRSAQGTRLPDRMQITLRSGPGRDKISLRSTLLTLSSTLGGGVRGGGNLTTRDVTFEGQTAEGIPMQFRGTLILTNGPGVIKIRHQRDIVGGWLAGDLVVGTNAAVQVGQPYSPR